LLGKLTPYETAIALFVDLAIFQIDTSVFAQTVCHYLENLPVADGSYTLQFPRLLREYIEMCDSYFHIEAPFAKSTFDSMYKTWTEKDKFNIDKHMTRKESETLVENANFSLLFKMFRFLLRAHHNRFFYTEDPLYFNTEKAYYTIFKDETKKQQSCDLFIDYLHASLTFYGSFSLVSEKNTEVRQVFFTASQESNAYFEEVRIRREEKRALSAHSRMPYHLRPKTESKSLDESRMNLGNTLKQTAAWNAKAPEQRIDVTKLSSVWKLPEALPEALPEVLPEALPEVLPEVLPEALPEADVGFTLVTGKKKKKKENTSNVNSFNQSLFSQQGSQSQAQHKRSQGPPSAPAHQAQHKRSQGPPSAPAHPAHPSAPTHDVTTKVNKSKTGRFLQYNALAE
jgi:hypothetical protein